MYFSSGQEHYVVWTAFVGKEERERMVINVCPYEGDQRNWGEEVYKRVMPYSASVMPLHYFKDQALKQQTFAEISARRKAGRRVHGHWGGRDEGAF